MKYKKDAIESSAKIMNKHIKNGLSVDDARKASIVTVETLLSVGVYPAWLSLYQRTLNYLISDNFNY
jgi:hypothetical protein